MKKILFIVTMMLVTSYGISAQEVKTKYQGEFDLSYSIGTGTFSTNRVNIHTIHGTKIGNIFSLGVGFGLDYYHEIYEKRELFIPIFANVKGYLPVNDKFSPFLSLDLGYSVGATLGVKDLGGFMWSQAVGIKYDKLKFQIGYTSQELSEDGIGIRMNAIQLMLGIVF